MTFGLKACAKTSTWASIGVGSCADSPSGRLYQHELTPVRVTNRVTEHRGLYDSVGPPSDGRQAAYSRWSQDALRISTQDRSHLANGGTLASQQFGLRGREVPHGRLGAPKTDSQPTTCGLPTRHGPVRVVPLGATLIPGRSAGAAGDETVAPRLRARSTGPVRHQPQL
jgi:hypothetical protein